MTTKTYTPFMERGLKEISKLRPRKTNYISQEIRERLNSKGIIGKNKQAYGALIKKALDARLLVPTGYERERNGGKMAPEYTVAKAV